MKPIGEIRCQFKEKFGTPRQSNSISSSKGILEFFSPYDRPEYFDGLENVSHLWVLGLFDKVRSHTPKVRPPRLGGNRKLGVFATRSPFRPNPISLSVFKIEEIKTGPSVRIHVSGIDLMDGTPIFDIKPFHPQADSPENPSGGWIDDLDDFTFEAVEWCPLVLDFLKREAPDTWIELEKLITEIIAADPRPAYVKESDQKKFTFLFDRFDMEFQVFENKALVTSIKIPTHNLGL